MGLARHEVQRAEQPQRPGGVSGRRPRGCVVRDVCRCGESVGDQLEQLNAVAGERGGPPKPQTSRWAGGRRQACGAASSCPSQAEEQRVAFGDDGLRERALERRASDIAIGVDAVDEERATSERHGTKVSELCGPRSQNRCGPRPRRDNDGHRYSAGRPRFSAKVRRLPSGSRIRTRRMTSANVSISPASIPRSPSPATSAREVVDEHRQQPAARPLGVDHHVDPRGVRELPDGLLVVGEEVRLAIEQALVPRLRRREVGDRQAGERVLDRHQRTAAASRST